MHTDRRCATREKQFTKDRIVEAALLVFARTDYASVTVDEIVAAADVSRQTFYIHFKSKADVLLEQLPIDDKHLRKLDRSIETRSAADLRSYLAAAIEWYEQSSALLLAVEVAASSDEEIARRAA